MQRNARRPRGPAPGNRELRERARDLRRLGDSYGSIAKTLGVPATTVQYWTQDVQPDKSGRWSIARALPKDPDATVVLEELGAIAAQSGGRVAGITNDEARWVALIAAVRPDLHTSPGELWHMARRFIEALAANDVDEVARLEGQVAMGAAQLRWPGFEAKQTDLDEYARRVARDLREGRNPFLDGTPYSRDEETSDGR